MISALLGGLGLFLVGMWLMTDGLKLAAGNALHSILQSWTNTRYRGLLTGFCITSLVQSSSAVTVATIGFANAGLLTLERAIWVIFGSNLGTTMTGWIVAFVGLKINMETYALPLIGIGMLIRLTGQKSRRAAIGQTIVGFGLFFLGIGVLKEAFETIGTQFSLPSMDDPDISSMFLYVLIGFLLTSLMQSSSAAIVITLSAADGGLITLSAAAATVIGANLGTTTTAIISVLGATSTAKRVAVSHILFNLIAASVAIVIILPMLALIGFVQEMFNLSTATAASLALFHTVFNILGVLLMLPISDWLVKYLNTMFVDPKELATKPLYMDKTSMEIPDLAIGASIKELAHLNSLVVTTCIDAIGDQDGDSDLITIERDKINKLSVHIADNVAQLMQAGITEEVARVLPEIILNTQRSSMNMENAIDIVEQMGKISIGDQHNEILEKINAFKQSAINLIILTTDDIPAFQEDTISSDLESLEASYDKIRPVILAAGLARKISMAVVDAQLTQLNLIRRVVRQSVKTFHHYQSIKDSIDANYSKPSSDTQQEIDYSEIPTR